MLGGRGNLRVSDTIIQSRRLPGFFVEENSVSFSLLTCLQMTRGSLKSVSRFTYLLLSLTQLLLAVKFGNVLVAAAAGRQPGLDEMVPESACRDADE